MNLCATKNDRINTLELKIARSRKQLTQEEMSKQLNISRQNYSLKETGKLIFTLKEASIIKDVLDLNKDEVINIFFPTM